MKQESLQGATCCSQGLGRNELRECKGYRIIGVDVVRNDLNFRFWGLCSFAVFAQAQGGVNGERVENSSSASLAAISLLAVTTIGSGIRS